MTCRARSCIPIYRVSAAERHVAMIDLSQLAVDLGQFLEWIKRLGPDVTIVSQLLGLEHAPVGDEAEWTHPPFSAAIANGQR